MNQNHVEQVIYAISQEDCINEYIRCCNLISSNLYFNEEQVNQIINYVILTKNNDFFEYLMLENGYRGLINGLNEKNIKLLVLHFELTKDFIIRFIEYHFLINPQFCIQVLSNFYENRYITKTLLKEISNELKINFIEKIKINKRVMKELRIRKEVELRLNMIIGSEIHYPVNFNNWKSKNRRNQIKKKYKEQILQQVREEFTR